MDNNIIKINEHWQDWSFQDTYLIDPAGNKFTKEDMISGLYYRRAEKSFHGDTNDILNLKTQLKKRIEMLESNISVSVNIGDKCHSFKIAL